MNTDLYFACKTLVYLIIVIIALILLGYYRYDRTAQIIVLIGAGFCIFVTGNIAAAIYSGFAAVGSSIRILFNYLLQLIIPGILLLLGIRLMLDSLFRR